MLKIIAADEGTTPSRAWVEAAWRAAPNIHPTWWREHLGITHSKLICDVRGGLADDLPHGVNVLLTEGQHTNVSEGVIKLAVVQDAHAKAYADVVLWQPPEGADDAMRLAACIALEVRVMRGESVAYGVSDAWLGSPMQTCSLSDWLAIAAQAAEQVWGRKKRPALRAFVLNFDVLNTAPLFYPSSTHKGQQVPLLEQAVQMGLWVLAEPVRLPDDTAQTQALQALSTLAEAEAELHKALHGQWPHMQGKPVFAVLPYLQQSSTPWYHPLDAAVWRQHIWPQMDAMFTMQNDAHYAAWHRAWHALLPYLNTIAAIAAHRAIESVMENQAQVLSAEFASHPLMHQHIALCASVPGVGGVVVPETLNTKALCALPDMPDIWPFFTNSAHHATR